jgi:hypothetical protein
MRPLRGAQGRDRSRYVALVPYDLGHLVGVAEFEQARGVLMQVGGYTAAEALSAIETFTRETGTPVEQCVQLLRTGPVVYAQRVIGRPNW